MAKGQAKPAPQARRLGNLNSWHSILALLLFAQAIAVLFFSRGVTLPVNTSYLTPDSLASAAANHSILAPAVHHLFDIKIAYLVAAFLLVGAVVHFFISTEYRKTYEANLKRGINKARRLEYIIGGGLLMLTVALINGIYDISTLIAIFALVEVLGLFSLIAEARKEVTERHPRASGKLTLVASFAPWLIIAIYLFGAQIYGDRALPAYVYFVDGSLFVLFLATMAFGFMQAQKKSKFGDVIYSENVYIQHAAIIP